MAGTAGAIRAGQAFIEMGLNNDPLTKGLKAAESQLKSFGIAVTQIGAAAGAAGAAITVPLLAMAKTFAEGTSALQHMSERTGISIEALSALSYAAKQTGIDLDTVEGAVRKMQKALTAGSLENQQAAQTFERLGLNVKVLEQLKPEKAFEVLADRISKIPNENARAGAAMLIFGKTGTSILPLIENMAALTKEAKEFGLVASTKGVEAGTRLQHAFNLLDKSIAFTQGTIASSLAPTLTEMNAAFARNLKTVREWIAANKPLVLQAFQIGLALTAVGTAFATLGGAFVIAGAVIGGVATTLGAIGAALAALTSPISLVIAGLGGLAAWFVTSTNAGGKSLQWLGDRFGDLKTTVTSAFKGIADALKAGDIRLAADILWTELKFVWLQGISDLDNATRNFLSNTKSAFADTSFDIATGWSEMWADMQKSSVSVGTFMQLMLNNIGADATKTASVFEFAFRTAMAHIQLKGKVLEDELNAINSRALGQGVQATQIQTGTASFLTQGAAGAVNQAEEDRKNRQKSINDQKEAADAARAKSALERQKRIDELHKKLDELNKKAKEEAGKVKPLAEEKKEGPQKEFTTPEELDKSIEDVKKKTVDVKGSFSAAAVQSFGIGDTLSEAVKENGKKQEKTNEKLDKIHEKLGRQQAVFAPA
jgi:hypothetical protein